MKRLQLSLSILLISTWSTQALADDEKPFTEVRVIQFVINNEAIDSKNALQAVSMIHQSTDDSFKKATLGNCAGKIPQPPEINIEAAAPLAVALGGIVLDWAFSRAMNGLNERLKKRIRAHSHSYASPLVYEDIFEYGEWTGDGESCVVMQRIECTASATSIDNGTASCGVKGNVELSVGIKMRNAGQYIQVLPYGLQLGKLKPEHHEGKATVAASFRIEAIGHESSKASGYAWRSEDLVVTGHACEVSRDRVPVGKCERYYSIDKTTWLRAPAIPVPPSLTQALVFSVGEVGEPRQGLKGFSAFLDATGGDISGALSEAFKKKIGLAEMK